MVPLEGLFPFRNPESLVLCVLSSAGNGANHGEL